MADLIDREELKEKLVDMGFYPAVVKSVIESVPAVDAMPVVRCEDCKHCIKDKMLCTHPRNLTFKTGLNVLPTHFCSYGERNTCSGEAISRRDNNAEE